MHHTGENKATCTAARSYLDGCETVLEFLLIDAIPLQGRLLLRRQGIQAIHHLRQLARVHGPLEAAAISIDALELGQLFLFLLQLLQPLVDGGQQFCGFPWEKEREREEGGRDATRWA